MMPTPREAVAQWADDRRFGPETKFAEIKAVGLPANEPKRSGFYLLRFEDDTFYLGESVDLRSRMGGHRTKWGDEIATVRLLVRTASKQELRRVERKLTHELEGVGAPLRNVLNASITSGVDALSELLDEEGQASWLRDPVGYNSLDDTPLKDMEGQSIRYSTAAKRYLEHGDEPEVTDLLRRFIEGCIPAPRATEFQYWSVSTGTYGNTRFPRRFCVSVGKMEVFVLSADKKRGGELFGHVNVRASVLDQLTDVDSFLEDHPTVQLSESPYDDAGSDAVRLDIDGLEAMTKLMSDRRVVAAAGALVLDLMRKHFCVYTRYHCPQLVERVYPELRRRPAESPTEAGSAPDLAVELPASSAQSVMDEPGTFDEIEDLGDVEIYWIVSPGPKSSNRNQVSDFFTRSEWRMDPNPRYESKVADMRPGERIAVRTRRNVVEQVPFDRRGHAVSVMDFHLRGVVTHNPGDGCSVQVKWEKPTERPSRFYLYTSQDTVWPLASGFQFVWDQLIDFAFFGGEQDIDRFRNAPFWLDRFGD